jgi:hypothetical protein
MSDIRSDDAGLTFAPGCYTWPNGGAVRAPSQMTLDDKLAAMVCDVRQLTEPIHMAHRGRILTHDPLLDQLRGACTPSGQTMLETVRRRARESRPPASTGAIDTLSAIYVGISYWHGKLALPSPDRSLDWQKTALQLIAGQADTLAPSVAEWLCTEVHGWWEDAARGSGWRPDDLRRLR